MRWLEQFGSTRHDEVRACAPDASGGLFVGGYLNTNGPGSYDAWLARHDANGQLLWSRVLATSDEDALTGLAPDGFGGVFAVGCTEDDLGGSNPNPGTSDVWVAHYDASGNPSWITQFGSSMHDWSMTAAADGAGGVLLCGNTRGPLVPGTIVGVQDAWIARVDAAGLVAWTHQFGTASWDRATSVVPDGTGGVWVAGETDGSFVGSNLGSRDAWALHFDANRNLIGSVQLGSTGDEVAQVIGDALGGVFLFGWTDDAVTGTNAGGTDAWLAHYDDTASQSWVVQFGTVSSEYIRAAAADGVGGIHLCGSTDGVLGAASAGNEDAWIARYDAAGARTWLSQFGTTELDSAYAIARGSNGAVLVGGVTDGAFSGSNGGGLDYWVTSYDPVIATRYCSPAVNNSTGAAARISAAGTSSVVANDLTLRADALPPHSFGFFLTSRMQGFTANPGGSTGDLCLGGSIGRFVGPGQIQNSGPGGEMTLTVDLTVHPTPNGLVAVLSGESWSYQGWFRDAIGGMPTSNLTDGVDVTFW